MSPHGLLAPATLATSSVTACPPPGTCAGQPGSTYPFFSMFAMCPIVSNFKGKSHLKEQLNWNTIMCSSPAPYKWPINFREWLSSLNEENLTVILKNRPDVTHPIPPGISSLAARLQLRASLARALMSLNAFELLTLEAASFLGAELEPVIAPNLVDALRQYLGAQVPDNLDVLVEEAVSELLSRALLYGSTVSFKVVPEAMNALPTGWQLFGVRAQEETDFQHALASVDERDRKVLNTLDQSGGTGITKDAAPDADPQRPIPRMIAQGLLIRIDDTTVRLPMPVRYLLRGQQPPLIPVLPDPRVEFSASNKNDENSAGTGLEIVRLMRILLRDLGHDPMPLLKDGVLGVRSVTALTRILDSNELTALRVLSLALSCNLVARGVPDPLPSDDTGGDYLCPTHHADTWLVSPLSHQWSQLIYGWYFHGTLRPWVVNTLDDKGKPQRFLSPATWNEKLPTLRKLTLSTAAQHCTSSGISDHSLRANIGFAAPLRVSRVSPEHIDQLIAEARWLGVLTANNGTTSVLDALVKETEATALSRLDQITQSLTPAEVTQLIPQADMTILAPGPLPQLLMQEMTLVGEAESMGLASVYRITESSIRRALDAGRTPEELTGFLKAHVLGELPQSIAYLIADVARRHGSLRGGPAMSYLRCSDEALLLEASRTPAAEIIGLRLIAPTVAVSQAPLVRVLQALREEGFHPVAEDANGISIDIRPAPSRVSATLPQRHPDEDNESHIAAAVASILRHDAAKEAAATGTKAAVHGSGVLSALQSAIRAKRTVTLGFVDKHGQAAQRVITPIAVSSGQLSAVDPIDGAIHRFTIHRITEVVINQPE
ncbi:hypothetical protein CP258_03135 [Corynebacterium pseudotuberculosis 258]|uniref:Helicase XPB/Ssl2 N-terminal domain-containing protein n=2 Tax=Corynebacterium pseudotuberculosis TaxID=1719 RepID=A0AAU8Q035_CORPS|nr:hypothetical protein CPCIP5297_03135 [Corynebacterium pseudotuberculosis CIP 52.97]AFK16238.2 hypothetical protein CP258_03135 [Corynebacterium pseudotuberculosis 258]